VRSCFRSANCEALPNRLRSGSELFCMPPKVSPTRCWPANCRQRCRRCCCSGLAIKPQGWPAFWKIGPAPAAQRKSLPNKKPPSSRRPCTALRKTRPIGVSVPWQKCRGSVPRPCNASGRNITSSPAGWRRSNSAPIRSLSPKSGTWLASTGIRPGDCAQCG